MEDEDALIHWTPVGDSSYVCCETLYPLPIADDNSAQESEGFSWGGKENSIVLEYSQMFCSGHGGLVACVRDQSKLVLQLGIAQREPGVRVCTLSGKLVESIEPRLSSTESRLGNKHGIFKAGWTGDDSLIVVEDTGWAHLYRDVGSGHAECTAFTLGPACEQEGLADVRVFSSGVCAQTKENHFWCIRDLTSCVPIRLADPDMPGSSVTCFDVIPSVDGAVEIVVGVESGLSIVDECQSVKFAEGMGPFVKVSASPNGLAIAAMNAMGVIYIFQNEDVVMSLPVEDTLSRLDGADTMHHIPSGSPKYVAWSGTNAIVVLWHDVPFMLFVVIDGTYEWIFVGDVNAICSEVDGVCLISQDGVQLCRLVPPTTVSVLEPGSVSPAALLHDARRLLGKDDIRASAEILDIVDQKKIEEASQACLDAAGFTQNPLLQQSLLRAGCFGLAFSPLASDGKYILKRGTRVVELARSLRILNALRSTQVGFPLTLVQLGSMGLRRVVERLCTLGHFLLALKICESIGIPPDSVLLKWAKKKISVSTVGCTDDELFAALTTNLNCYAEISWAVIAEHALARGRPNLAGNLVGLDRSLKMQIPLLLNTGRFETAVSKACIEGDPDTIFHLLRRESSHKYVFSQNEYSSIRAMLFTCIWRQLPGTIEDAISKMGDSDLQSLYACMNLVESQNDSRWSKEFFETNEANSKDGKFFSIVCTAAHRLPQVQKSIEASSGREGFIGLNVSDTIRQCFAFGLFQDAKKIAKEFKVPERQCMMIHLDQMASSRDWVGLSHFASKVDTKSTLRMEDVLEAANKYDAPPNVFKALIDEAGQQQPPSPALFGVGAAKLSDFFFHNRNT